VSGLCSARYQCVSWWGLLRNMRSSEGAQPCMLLAPASTAHCSGHSVLVLQTDGDDEQGSGGALRATCICVHFTPTILSPRRTKMMSREVAKRYIQWPICVAIK